MAKFVATFKDIDETELFGYSAELRSKGVELKSCKSYLDGASRISFVELECASEQRLRIVLSSIGLKFDVILIFDADAAAGMPVDVS